MSYIVSLGEAIPLLTLLPGNHTQKQKSRDLQNTLGQYFIILNLAMKALKALKKGRLQKFDGLVGENSCQIRAVMVADIFQQLKGSSTLDGYVQQVNGFLASVSKILKNNFERQSFQELLKKEKLELELPQWLFAATLAYQLCITKTSDLGFIKENGVIIRSSNEKTDFSLFTQKLENCPALSKKFLKSIDQLARTTLSRLSVQYVQYAFTSIVNINSLNEEEICLNQLIHAVKDDGNGRSTIPCFAFMDVLLRYARVKKVPIFLSIKIVDPETLELGKNLPFYYQSNGNGYSYLEDFSREPGEQELILMEGYSMGSNKLGEETLTQKLLSLPLEYNILGNDAAHHQYAGDKKDLIRPSFARCEYYREIALKHGFCKENPELCYIDHVYAGTLKERV